MKQAIADMHSFEGISITNLTKKGSFFLKDYSVPVPELSHPEDFLFFSILGNEILEKKQPLE